MTTPVGTYVLETVVLNWTYRNENDDIRKHGSALWEHRKRTCPVRINEDVSPREMGIYHHISAALLRFIQGAPAVPMPLQIWRNAVGPV